MLLSGPLRSEEDLSVQNSLVPSPSPGWPLKANVLLVSLSVSFVQVLALPS